MSFIDDNYDYSDQSGYESNLEVSQENLQDEITESEVREMVVSQPREMVMTPPREMIETPPVLTPSPYEVINAETPKFCCSGDPSASFIKDTSNTDGLATEEDEGGVYCDEEGYVDSEDDEDWVLKSEMYLNNNTLDSDDDSDEDEGYNEPKQKWYINPAEIDDPTPRNYRFTYYRSIFFLREGANWRKVVKGSWKGIRILLPGCCVKLIRTLYPEPKEQVPRNITLQPQLEDADDDNDSEELLPSP